MARRNIYKMNYARLAKLLGCPPGEMLSDRCYRFRAQGFMDLVVEVLPRCSHTDATVLSLAHYFKQHGDLCQDPEMTVRVFPPGFEGFRELAPFERCHPLRKSCVFSGLWHVGPDQGVCQASWAGPQKLATRSDVVDPQEIAVLEGAVGR